MRESQSEDKIKKKARWIEPGTGKKNQPQEGNQWSRNTNKTCHQAKQI